MYRVEVCSSKPGNCREISRNNFITTQLPDADLEKDIFRTKTSITVSDLARKSPRVLARKSNLYHWNLATIAVFYGLPVVQLMVTYQEMSNSTGNQGSNSEFTNINFIWVNF